MMRLVLFVFAVCVLSAALPRDVAAQCGAAPMLDLPDGHVAMSFSATERREVEQDLLVASLSYIATGRDSRALQDEINSAMKDAVARARKEQNIKAQTGTYQVYEMTDPRTGEKKWRGSQNMTLKSKDADDILDLVGDLQEMELTMNGLSYTLDPETAVSVKDSLMEAALVQLQNRADRAAKALGKSSAELRNVSIDNNDMPYPQSEMYARSMAMESIAADIAAPVAEAGETTISLTVSASAILKP